MNESEKLLGMKKKIDKAKADVSRLEGSRDQLYKTLEKDFECKALKEAEKKVKEIGKELDKKETALAEGTAGLESSYAW
jgi:septation ring formation regulator EzrA